MTKRYFTDHIVNRWNQTIHNDMWLRSHKCTKYR